MTKRNRAQHKRLHSLVEALKPSADSDLSCEECQMALPAYVEAELEEKKVSEHSPDVWRHLMLCEECGALYADLLEVSMLEERGELPLPDSIPTPDLSFLPSSADKTREAVRKIARTIVDRLEPEAATDFSTLCDLFFERLQTLGDTFRLRSTSELALAFGADAPPTLFILATTFSATKAVQDTLEKETLTTTQLADLLYQTAHEEARRMGLSRIKADAFAKEYAQAAQRHPIPSV